MTSALRSALGVAVRGSVWLGVWLCVGCVWIYKEYRLCLRVRDT